MEASDRPKYLKSTWLIVTKGGIVRLIDQIAQSVKPIQIDDPRRGQVFLPGANALSEQVKATSTRYILQPDVVQATTELVFQQTGLLYNCLDIIRIPSDSLWLEWQTKTEVSARSEAVTSGATCKMGVLVISDPGGRSGSMQVVWEGNTGIPEPSPARLIFDLDNKPSASSTRLLYAIANDEHKLTPLMRHVALEIQPDWLKYYQSGGSSNMRDIYSQLGAAVIYDAPFVLGFCLLIAARSQLIFQASDLVRLNLLRAKQSKPLLLEHVEVGAWMHRIEPNATTNVSTDTRVGARLHHVRGHFVRRANKIFWRSPHLRGEPLLGTMPKQVKRISL